MPCLWPRPGPREDNRSQARVLDVDGNTGRNQLGTARGECQRRVETGAQIDAGGTHGRVRRQRKILADAFIEHFQLNTVMRQFAAPGGV